MKKICLFLAIVLLLCGCSVNEKLISEPKEYQIKDKYYDYFNATQIDSIKNFMKTCITSYNTLASNIDNEGYISCDLTSEVYDTLNPMVKEINSYKQSIMLTPREQLIVTEICAELTAPFFMFSECIGVEYDIEKNKTYLNPDTLKDIKLQHEYLLDKYFEEG